MTNPGINPQANLSHFNNDEVAIVETLSKEWYVTHGGAKIHLGAKSIYKYFLVKPTKPYEDMFNLEREIAVIFSPYQPFEPRTLDAIDYAIKQHQKLRVEKICSVLISKDEQIELRLKELLKNDIESQIVIPFSYNELANKRDDFFIRNRFKSHFYTRDLFAFQSPLKKDLYFFGRKDIIHAIVNRHRTGENSGLFGLRKTGKTSVIFGVERALLQADAKSVFIDCQNPSLHIRRWNKALHYIILELKQQNHLGLQTHGEDKYTEENASICFEEDISLVYKQLGQNNILLIFDEIENITFGISPSEHWSNGYDFIFFWQTLRSLFQKLRNVFSYLIVGTNPMCVEHPTINNKDNPIFNQIPFEYLPGFDVPQTREMVRKLGRIMGLKFDEVIYGKLTEDFGGHPFLMRHVCSVINSIVPSTRPVRIDKTIYDKAKEKFIREHSNYIEMVLNVLQQFHKDEFSMMEYLAQGDIQTFTDFAQMSPYYTNHLIGYGIIEQNFDSFSFKTDAIRGYLVKKLKFKKIHLTVDEMHKEISERRNKLEPNIRLIVRNQLRATFGKSDATEKVLNVLGEPRKSKYRGYSYEDLFDTNQTELYFEDLRKLIAKHWDCFTNIFSKGIEDFNLKMQTINKYRADAHAKKIEQVDMELFRVCIGSIEDQVNDFLS